MATNKIGSATTERIANENTFTSWDGAELFFRAWPPEVASDKAIVLLHRGHEHSGRFQDLVNRLKLEGFWIFACDARGHGRSPGRRGYAESFQSLVRDLDAFVAHLSRAHRIPTENVAIVANSIGAVVAATWVHDYAPPVRALVLATPAFRVKLYVPLAIAGLRMLQRLKGNAFVKSYVRPSMLTHDEDEVRRIAEDDLLSRSIAVNVLLDLHDTSTRVLSDAGAIHTPTLVLSAGSDWVVDLKAQRRFFESISSQKKDMEVYPGFYHAVLHEQERERPIGRIREFLSEVFETPATKPSLLGADQKGHTKEKYDELRRPLSLLSARRVYFGATKLVLNTIGRLSDGIRIGWRKGFNSGQSLDYVYRNQAQGTTPLGRLTDRLYLDSPGWRGVRRRKVHLEHLLSLTIDDVLSRNEPVQILDIATGPGRYVLGTLSRFDGDPVTAVLRDRDQAAVELGRQLAKQQNLSGVTFEIGDAFDEQSLAAIEPRPTIAIVSGLYELFPENACVAASLRGVGRAIQDGGYLIYTNQPWHPQLEFIARCLVGFDGQPWIMRCRTQLEMDQLVEQAGFEKLDMLQDEQGIFTVSRARRTARR